MDNLQIKNISLYRKDFNLLKNSQVCPYFSTFIMNQGLLDHGLPSVQRLVLENTHQFSL